MACSRSRPASSRRSRTGSRPPRGGSRRCTAVLEAARDALVGHDGRPVSRFHTETALRQIAGIEELIADALASAGDAAATDDRVASLVPRLTAAAETARAAVAAFETHLREVVLPASDGEGRLGHALFAEKMRHTMRSDSLTADGLLAAAETRVRRGPRRDGPACHRALAHLATR